MQQPSLLTTLLLSATTALASSSFILAKEAPVLHPRTTFQGGWPIEATTCPSNTTACSNTGACCPNSTQCYTEGLSGDAVCCPNSDNCYQTATAIPLCADPAWTLYIGNYDFYCCSAGQIGILPNKADDPGAGLCVEKGSNVAASALATPYASAQSTASSAAASSGASAATTGSAQATKSSQGLAASLVSSELGKVTGAAPAPTASKSSGANAAGAGRRGWIEVVGAVIGGAMLVGGL